MPDYRPTAIVYEEFRRVEVIERDVPVIWRTVADGALEYALDMETREVIGARIALPGAPVAMLRNEAILKAATSVRDQTMLTSKGTPYLTDSKQSRRALRALLNAFNMPLPWVK